MHLKEAKESNNLKLYTYIFLRNFENIMFRVLFIKVIKLFYLSFKLFKNIHHA